jgi:serine/threonine-protein kinase
MFRRARELRAEQLGRNHPSVAVTSNNLANALVPQGKYEEALTAARHAVAAWEETLGPNHPNIAVGLATLGDVLTGLERHDEAVELQYRAVDVIERAWGPEHPRMAATRYNLGVMLQRAGRHADAVEAFRETERIAKEQGGYILCIARESLGSSLLELGRPAEALEAFERALVTPDPASDGPMVMASSLAGKGRTLLALHRPEAAAQVLERGLAMEASDGVHAEIRFSLGRALWQMKGHGDRARALVQQAREYHASEAGDPEILAEIDAWLREHSP